jgi:hypothetical protein
MVVNKQTIEACVPVMCSYLKHPEIVRTRENGRNYGVKSIGWKTF